MNLFPTEQWGWQVLHVMAKHMKDNDGEDTRPSEGGDVFRTNVQGMTGNLYSRIDSTGGLTRWRDGDVVYDRR
jgi:hypothetical protein